MANAMKQGRMCATWTAALLVMGSVIVNPTASAQSAKPKIVHDSEYYILETQHSEQ